MFKPILKISHKTLVVLLEIAAVVALLLGVALGVFLWRVSQGPISISFAKDYVEEALSSEATDFRVSFDDIVFSWPELQGPFLLDLSGLRVQKGEGEVNALNVDTASVGLSRGALMFGRIRPVSVIIRSPSLELARTQDGALNLFVRDETAQPEAKPAGNMNAGENIAQIFKDMAHHTRGSFLGRLDEFEILNAKVAVRDHQAGLSWYLTDLNFVMEEHPQGVSASVSVPLPGGRTESAGFVFDMVYRRESDDFRLSGQVRDINPSIMSRFLSLPDLMGEQDLYFTGSIEAALDGAFRLSRADFEGAIPQGVIDLDEEFAEPVVLDDVHLKSSYDAAAQEMTISELSGKVGGIPFNGDAGAIFTADSVRAPLRLSVGAANLEQVLALFPKSEHDGHAYEWLGQRIKDGEFSDVVLEMELAGTREKPELYGAEDEAAMEDDFYLEDFIFGDAGADDLAEEEGADITALPQRDTWSLDLAKFVLNFAFKNAGVLYQDTLMPAEQASGKGMLDLGPGNRLEITEGTAKIGEMAATDIAVTVTGLMTRGGGHVDVTGKLNGPFATALRYIASEPINMGPVQIGIDAAKVKGAFDGSIHVAMPTLKDLPKDQVTVEVEGTLTDILIPDAVKGLPLSGGPLAVKTEPGGFRVKGDAQLGGRAGKIEWHQNFVSAGKDYSMQVKSQMNADKELRNHFGVDLDDYISGTMPVDVTYTAQVGGDAVVDVKGDLGPVRLYIDPFKFEKPAGVAGSVAATAVLKKDVLTELRDITIKSRDISASKANIKFAPRAGRSADLSSGSLPNVTLGKSQMDVTFAVDKTDTMKVKAKGPVFDLSPFLREGEASDMYVRKGPKEKRQKMSIDLSAETMLAENQQSAKANKVYIELDDEGDITRMEYNARVGAGDMAVRFNPDSSGKRIFRLETNDAGAALRTFGLYENINGGTLLIYGEPKEKDLRGNIYGTMRMERFRVVKAPALASLLSLMSLTGVQQILGNQGLAFKKLESGFEWRFRPEGNLLIIKDGKTSGSSVGLTFSGVMDRGKKTTDISGTIIPMTEVNSLISKIPLVGNILGGSTGLIAATYSMKGPTNDPDVSVNPLSVLAPGILRRILFEGGYESKIPDDAAAVPAAATEAKRVAPAKQNSRTVQTRTN